MLQSQKNFRTAFLLTVVFLVIFVLPVAFARSTSICRTDISDPDNSAFNEYKKTIFCPTDYMSDVAVAGPDCGNGVTDPGETCDDGNNTLGDGCSATCQIENLGSVCQNGITEPPEECDDGNLNENDGCKSSCEFGEISGDILSVKITRITNEEGTDTTIFSRQNQMTVQATVTNNSSIAIYSSITFSVTYPGNVAVETIIATDPQPANFPSGTSTHTFTFDWGAPTDLTNGTYIVKAAVPPQPGEENFLSNNSDFIFVTLGEATNTFVSVPETNILLAPMIAFAVIALVYFSSAKKNKGVKL